MKLRPSRRFVVATLVLGVAGFCAAWALALSSEDYKYLTKQLREDPALRQQLRLTGTPILMAFKVSFQEDRRSRFSFLLQTEKGLKLDTFTLDKNKNPWEVVLLK